MSSLISNGEMINELSQVFKQLYLKAIAEGYIAQNDLTLPTLTSSQDGTMLMPSQHVRVQMTVKNQCRHQRD
ncbi:MAG: hypothetical protein ACLRUB_02625 [Streptococcus sp.]